MGHNLLPLIEIGLTDLPKPRWAIAHLTHPYPTSLNVSTIRFHSSWKNIAFGTKEKKRITVLKNFYSYFLYSKNTAIQPFESSPTFSQKMKKNLIVVCVYFLFSSKSNQTKGYVSLNQSILKLRLLTSVLFHKNMRCFLSAVLSKMTIRNKSSSKKQK